MKFIPKFNAILIFFFSVFLTLYLCFSATQKYTHIINTKRKHTHTHIFKQNTHEDSKKKIGKKSRQKYNFYIFLDL